MMLFTALLIVATLFIAPAPSQPDTAPPLAPSNRLAHARAARLTRGVNMSHWYWLPHQPSVDAERKMVTPADVDQLKAAGITHVRVPIEPDFLWDAEKHSLRHDHLQRYQHGISLFTEKNIIVVIDPHPSARSPWADPNHADFLAEFTRFWAALAAAFRDVSPDLLLLEVINEPHDIADPAKWPSLQKDIVAAIRAAAPLHTIIATGDSYSSVEGLLRLEPLADLNIIYTFHFYDPHTFTHQGATWGAPNWVNLKNIPYPATPDIVKAAMNGMNDAGKRELRWYADKNWNAETLRARVKNAADWGERHNVPLWCGEFGAYRETTPPASRQAWFTDLTTALRESNIGWCMWDYAGGFALVHGEPGARSFHEDTAAAVGLTPSQR